MFNLNVLTIFLCLASCQAVPVLVQVVEDVVEEIAEDVIVAESEKMTPKLPVNQPQPNQPQVQDAIKKG
jgi:hypothetical protein